MRLKQSTVVETLASIHGSVSYYRAVAQRNNTLHCALLLEMKLKTTLLIC